MTRWLKLQPAAVGAAAAAVYAAAAMLYRVLVAHDGPLDTDILVAAAMAVWGLWTRAQVTPLARPRTREGHPLHGPVAPGQYTGPTPRSMDLP